MEIAGSEARRILAGQAGRQIDADMREQIAADRQQAKRDTPAASPCSAISVAISRCTCLCSQPSTRKMASSRLRSTRLPNTKVAPNASAASAPAGDGDDAEAADGLRYAAEQLQHSAGRSH